MKKTFVLIFALLLSGLLFAQSEDYGKICIAVCLPDNSNIPADAKEYVMSKLEDIVSENGMADRITERFVITARVNLIQNDIMPTNPARISQRYEIKFVIGDVVENKIYATTTIKAAGIGLTEAKAYIQAFQRIQTSSPAIQNMVEEAKRGIMEYYTTNCPAIQMEADRLAATQNYEQAIASLVAVPNVCEECFIQSQQKAIDIFNQMINKEGLELIHKAESAWYVKEDYDCAAKALDFLLQVNPLAECRKDADNLAKKIDKKLRADEAAIAQAAAEKEKREWEFKMRQYEDYVAFRWAEMGLMSQQIQAVERVGVEYARHQPQQQTNLLIVK